MKTHKQRGVTLVELMVVISIVAVLMAIGVPSYRYVTTANRISSEINGLLGDLQFARAEAIKEGQTVTVCATADASTCVGTTTWTTGWLVFMGTTPSNNGMLRIQKALSSGDTLTANNNISALSFSREGFAIGLPAAFTLLTLKDSTANSAYSRCLQITIVGAMTTQTHGQGTC